ncbi:Reticulocyte-binding protein 2 homolog a [Durusdinium trenchii]|uniref:Reticulocyte-binding protein 2 homolog a n=1 Tax=Durusdinium trenchii TaxID=1381693 RepID=A0ABP0QP63_9DINO
MQLAAFAASQLRVRTQASLHAIQAMFSQSMFSCRACVPRDRDADTVRVTVADIEAREVIERWDAGEGRFVELRSGDRLLVGAETREMADQLVEAWRERRQRQQNSEEALAEEKLQKEKEAQEEEERKRKEKEAEEEEQRQAELQRQKEEEERVRLEAKVQERKQRVEEFLKSNQFKDMSTPKRVQEKVLGLPLISKSIYPIHLAAELGDAAMVEMLLKEGASAKQKTSTGKTPAELAKKKSKGGSHDAVLKALGEPIKQAPRAVQVGGA